jgi:hypothetical protein
MVEILIPLLPLMKIKKLPKKKKDGRNLTPKR